MIFGFMVNKNTALQPFKYFKVKHKNCHVTNTNLYVHISYLMQVSAETLSKTMTVLKLALLIGAYGSLILIPISKGAYIFHRGRNYHNK